MAKRSEAKSDKDKDLLERICERFEYINNADKENRQRARDDTEFVYVPGSQWTDAVKKQRKTADDPCMEFPQLKQFVAQVVNDQRQNRPGIRVHPAGGEASEEVAEILQGLIRGIEYDSRAESVYDCGYQHSVVSGRGYWRIVSEYEREDSFNQKLCIKRIADPQSVFLDPDCQEPDGGDRQYGFVIEVLHKDEFKRRYPDAKELSFDAAQILWYPKEEHVIVADYYERVATERTLVTLADGTTGYKDELEKRYGSALMPAMMLDQEGNPVERKTNVYSIAWYTVGGGEQILERHTWPGSIIPVVCTMGDEIVIDGKRVYQGLITQAKDAQRLFNFGMTQQAVTLSLAPRAPWIAAAEAIEGYEAMWKTSNTTNYSHLPYNAFNEAGEPIPPPQRSPGAAVDSGWLNWTQQMMGLMRSTIGMYESSLGMRSQETSGIAIGKKEQQSDTATFHFQDNLARAIALTGRILVECIPTYYDTERIVHIVGPDDEPRTETINSQAPDPQSPYNAITMRDVTVGEYAVTVQAGPGYATKRQETAEMMMQMVQAYPPLMQFAGDIIVRIQDIPDADLLADRIKMSFPPQIQQMIAQSEQKGGKAAPPDPAMQEQIQQMTQQLQQAQGMMQQLQAENAQLKQGAEAKVAAAQMDAQAKAQAAQVDANVRLQAEELNAETELQRADIQAQAAIAKAEIDARVKMAIAQMNAPPPAVEPDADEGMGKSDMLVEVMSALAQSMQQLAAAHAAPKEAITPEGRVIRVQTVNPRIQ